MSCPAVEHSATWPEASVQVTNVVSRSTERRRLSERWWRHHKCRGRHDNCGRVSAQPRSCDEGERGSAVVERQFEKLTHRFGRMALPRLPRRGVVHLLSGAVLTRVARPLTDREASAASCKREGAKCDKKKCKKQDKKCCCKNLKCKNGFCESTGGRCPTDAAFDLEWGSSGSGQGDFDNPFGITTDSNGNVYVTDTDNFRVQVFNANGNFSDEWGQQGNENEQFQMPLGIAFGQDGDGNNRLYVTDPDQSSDGRKLRKFRVNGTHEGNLGVSDFDQPVGVAVDGDNNIWVVDTNSVFLFDEDGNLVTSWEPDGTGSLNDPAGIAIFEEDNQSFVYVADTDNDRVVKFEYVNNSADGLEFVDAAGSSGSGNDRFNGPTGIVADECGNLWVADRFNNRIQQLDKNLNFESRFSSSFVEPTGVALSPNGNSLYVVSSTNDRVRKFTLS